MTILIRVEKTLEEFWITEEEENMLTNEEILDLIKEDVSAFLENANFLVVRIKK